MKQTSIRLRDDQYEWQQDTEEFNLSGFVREKLDERMEADDD